MTIDPFRLGVALIPLAAYLFVLGWIHWQGRPAVIGGGRDLAGLALGLCGLAVIGPLELFMPVTAAAQFGQFVWLFLLALYGLLAVSVVLVSWPRVLIYNVTLERLRPVLSETAFALDPEARWAGESLVLPSSGIQLHVESTPLMRNVSLVANGSQQDLAAWQRLEADLAAGLAGVRSEPNPVGHFLMGLSLLMLGSTLAYMAAAPEQLADGFRAMVWQ